MIKYSWQFFRNSGIANVYPSFRKRMEYQQRISKTDLARNTRRVIREAQRGYTVLVENHGQAEVAIMAIIDFQRSV